MKLLFLVCVLGIVYAPFAILQLFFPERYFTKINAMFDNFVVTEGF